MHIVWFVLKSIYAISRFWSLKIRSNGFGEGFWQCAWATRVQAPIDETFSSSERNVEFNFFDNLLSVARLSVRLSVCLSTFHIFDFFTRTIRPNVKM